MHNRKLVDAFYSPRVSDSFAGTGASGELEEVEELVLVTKVDDVALLLLMVPDGTTLGDEQHPGTFVAFIGRGAEKRSIPKFESRKFSIRSESRSPPSLLM